MAKVIAVDTRVNDIDGFPIEYFCKDCLQLRLSFRSKNSNCGNCNSEHIILGDVGELNKQALIKKYKPKED